MKQGGVIHGLSQCMYYVYTYLYCIVVLYNCIILLSGTRAGAGRTPRIMYYTCYTAVLFRSGSHFAAQLPAPCAARRLVMVARARGNSADFAAGCPYYVLYAYNTHNMYNFYTPGSSPYDVYYTYIF